MCPDWASETRDHQHHITGDIGLAVRQLLAVTGDTTFLTAAAARRWVRSPLGPSLATGCDMVRDIAEFWAGRASYNSSSGLYDITDVMGPDEYHARTDNNVYTNIVAALAIYFADYSTFIAGCRYAMFVQTL